MKRKRGAWARVAADHGDCFVAPFGGLFAASHTGLLSSRDLLMGTEVKFPVSRDTLGT